MKRLVSLVAAVLTLALLAGCSSKPAEQASGSATGSQAGKPVTLKVGVTAGVHEEIMKQVAPILAKENITLDIKVFTDYKLPNQALESKELDVNSFQHQPYLEKENKERGFHLVSAAKGLTFPMGIYSKKIKKLDELKEGARIAIPNDATNGGRALLLFQSAGLIKVKPEAGILAAPRDIIENPKKLKFEELDAAMLPRMLPDVDAAVINTNFAIDAGLVPAKDSIYLEKDSPYVNILAVRAEDKDRPEIQKLVKAYQSNEIMQFIETKYQGSVVAGW